ncbi:MAG: oligopeptide/dipeptide ABC transporter ATP-binding protein, partial [Acidimicrobiia bacterium]
VERAGARDLYTAPCHPYTQGLLASVTRVDREPTERLPTIGGSPPSLISLPTGCRFHPRCAHVESICVTEEPPLVDLGQGRLSACHLAEQFLPQTEGRIR